MSNELETKEFKDLPDILDQDDIAHFTAYLNDLYKATPTITDEQCPTSWCYHSAKHNDKVLEGLGMALKHLVADETDGKKLLFSHAYVRRYIKGAILEPHADKRELEYTLTVALGSSDETTTWPIYLQQDDGDILTSTQKAGDGLIVKGVKRIHWRNALKKDYAWQVFLHYLDADGSNRWESLTEKPEGTDHTQDCTKGDFSVREDGLKEIENYKGAAGSLGDFVYESDYWLYDGKDGIPEEICNLTLDQYRNHPDFYDAEVGGTSKSTVDKTVRNVMKLDLPVHAGISAYLVAAAMNANAQAWEFDVKYCSQSEYLRYPGSDDEGETGGRYTSHRDLEFQIPGRLQYRNCRKLTALSVINDGFEGGQFYIIVDGRKIYPPQKKGNILIFPTLCTHGCEPVTNNVERHAVVAWIDGPPWR